MHYFDRAVAAFLAAARLAVTTTVLVAWVIGEFLYRGSALDLHGVGAGWLTLAHLLVPAGFFCVFMTNRRYGPGYAFAQVIAAGAAVIGFALFAGSDFNAVMPLDTVPPLREAAAFGMAFFLASLISITVFDAARGRYWWTAPFFGFLSAAVLFAGVFFPVNYAGSNGGWLMNGAVYMAILAAEGLALLIPFWALRRIVPPVSGFGGY